MNETIDLASREIIDRLDSIQSINEGPTPLFIFSLPRAGSTLVQRLLAAHSEIATVSETHLLLPLFYAFRENGIFTEYAQRTVHLAHKDVLRELPQQEESYKVALRTFILTLYRQMVGGETRYFLDKSPRYYLIIQEIIDLFPEARFIILWRNPLAVLASILTTWHAGRWRLHRNAIDFLQGPLNLIEAVEKYGDRVCPIQYEELVAEPEKTLRSVSSYLGLSFEPGMLTDFVNVKFRGNIIGDEIGTKRYKEISTKPLTKWHSLIANPIRKAWCRWYLGKYLGAERLEAMGYNLQHLLLELDSLPMSRQYLLSDCWRMPYSYLYRLFDLHILGWKWKQIRAGDSVFMHW